MLAWWFLSQKDRSARLFGIGLSGYALGIACWCIVVLLKPTDLKPLIFLGTLPFLAAHLAYARAATNKYTLLILTAILITSTLIARTIIYPSEPYFSEQGLLFFGLHPIVSALYIATISVSFLPAIKAITPKIRQEKLRTTIGIGFFILYLNSLVLVVSRNSNLLTLNGFVMGVTLLILVTKLLHASISHKSA